jgi:hypothetical protein
VTPKTLDKEFQHLTSFCARCIELGCGRNQLCKEDQTAEGRRREYAAVQREEAKAILGACSRLGETEDQRGGYASYSADQIRATYLNAIDLPAAERELVFGELCYIGVTAGSVFPGFDGTCEEVARTKPPAAVIVKCRFASAHVRALRLRI